MRKSKWIHSWFIFVRRHQIIFNSSAIHKGLISLFRSCFSFRSCRCLSLYHRSLSISFLIECRLMTTTISDFSLIHMQANHALPDMNKSKGIVSSCWTNEQFVNDCQMKSKICALFKRLMFTSIFSIPVNLIPIELEMGRKIRWNVISLKSCATVMTWFVILLIFLGNRSDDGKRRWNRVTRFTQCWTWNKNDFTI